MALIKCITEDGEPFDIDDSILEQIRNNRETEKALVKEANDHIDALNAVMKDLAEIGSDMNLRLNYPSNKLVMYNKKAMHVTPLDITLLRRAMEGYNG